MKYPAYRVMGDLDIALQDFRKQLPPGTICGIPDVVRSANTCPGTVRVVAYIPGPRLKFWMRFVVALKIIMTGVAP